MFNFLRWFGFLLCFLMFVWACSFLLVTPLYCSYSSYMLFKQIRIHSKCKLTPTTHSETNQISHWILMSLNHLSSITGSNCYYIWSSSICEISNFFGKLIFLEVLINIKIENISRCIKACFKFTIFLSEYKIL